MESPPLGPGGEDITWPHQVAPRGRKASSTRKIKPQNSNLKPGGGPDFRAFWVGGLAASCGVGGRFAGCGPPPPFFSFGGVCLFLPLPSLGWRTHWSAFGVVFRVAVGGCVLPGRVPAPWVGRVMYTLGSAPLPAGLGSGFPAGRLRQAASCGSGLAGLGLSVSFRLRGAGFHLLGRPPPLLPGARWPLAGVWRAGAAPSRLCAGLFWLVFQVRVSRAVVCRSVPRCVASCCGV